jgi:hypothetical protein
VTKFSPLKKQETQNKTIDWLPEIDISILGYMMTALPTEESSQKVSKHYIITFYLFRISPTNKLHYVTADFSF